MTVPAMVDREGMSMTIWMDNEEEYDRDRRKKQRERHNCDRQDG